jgi:carboxypeptidase C (cathepsin A)
MSLDRRALLASSLAATALTVAPQALAQGSPPPMAVRRGKITLGGKTIAWKAETGETVLKNAAGQPAITIFSVAYMAQGAKPSTRPVTFLWNGGPGGATWHLREHLSPRITKATEAAPRYAFVDNPNSIIDASDLVFIDAPGTGYSRMIDPASRAEYWGIEGDGRAFSDFIAAWLKSHGRLSSPIFLIGESYGGTRAGQVVRNLAEQKIELTGVTLISPALGSTGAGLRSSRRESAALSIPPEACVAWYYKKGAHTAKTLDQVAAEAEAFADGPYAAAIAKGDAIDPAERTRVAAQLSGFIGLPAEQIEKSNLFVSGNAFRTDLLAERKLTLEGDDGRGSRPTPPAGQSLPPVKPDDKYDVSASIEGLVREDLGYRAVGAYSRDPGEINRAWNSKLTQPADTDLILKERMAANPKLRVLLVGGYFDTIVPYPMPLKALQAALPANRLKRQMYATGHAVFEDVPLRPKTVADLRAWYASFRT